MGVDHCDFGKLPRAMEILRLKEFIARSSGSKKRQAIRKLVKLESRD